MGKGIPYMVFMWRIRITFIFLEWISPRAMPPMVVMEQSVISVLRVLTEGEVIMEILMEQLVVETMDLVDKELVVPLVVPAQQRVMEGQQGALDQLARLLKMAAVAAAVEPVVTQMDRLMVDQEVLVDLGVVVLVLVVLVFQVTGDVMVNLEVLEEVDSMV